MINPLVAHYPYLPAAFLVQVPLELVVSSTGGHVDPRWLYVLAVAAAVALVARSPRPGWARAAAMAALGLNLAVVVYLSWGANDSPAAALVALTAYLVVRHPIAAGVALAIAVSLKALLIVAVLPLMVFAHRSGGMSLVRRFGGAATVVVVAATTPYLLWSPRDLVEDTVSFNLGLTDLTYPTSGIGLGATFPDLFSDPVIVATSALFLLVTSVAGVRIVAGNPSASNVLFVAGCLVVAGLLPARSFQISYLPLPVMLWAFAWLDAADWWPQRWRPRSGSFAAG